MIAHIEFRVSALVLCLERKLCLVWLLLHAPGLAALSIFCSGPDVSEDYYPFFCQDPSSADSPCRWALNARAWKPLARINRVALGLPCPFPVLLLLCAFRTFLRRCVCSPTVSASSPRQMSPSHNFMVCAWAIAHSETLLKV